MCFQCCIMHFLFYCCFFSLLCLCWIYFSVLHFYLSPLLFLHHIIITYLYKQTTCIIKFIKIFFTNIFIFEMILWIIIVNFFFLNFNVLLSISSTSLLNVSVCFQIFGLTFLSYSYFLVHYNQLVFFHVFFNCFNLLFVFTLNLFYLFFKWFTERKYVNLACSVNLLWSGVKRAFSVRYL